MARYAGESADGDITRITTPSSWPVGSTFARCTATCGACAYESKKRSRFRFPRQKKSLSGHAIIKFRIVADFRPTTRDSVRATWPWWRPSLPRGGMVALPMALLSGQVNRALWTCSEGAVRDG